jgi:hypothetical protein
MQTNRAQHKGPRGVLVTATGVVLLGLVGPGLGTAPPAGAVRAAPTAFVANNLSPA